MERTQNLRYNSVGKRKTLQLTFLFKKRKGKQKKNFATKVLGQVIIHRFEQYKKKSRQKKKLRNEGCCFSDHSSL